LGSNQLKNYCLSIQIISISSLFFIFQLIRQLFLRYNWICNGTKKIIKTIEKNRLLLITATFIGLVLGIIFYFLPSKYISSGSFYVSKKTDKSLDFFTYEGYYAQQSAITYADSVITLAKSVDIKKDVLEK